MGAPENDMTDEEFTRWMNSQENAVADSEEIEVGSVYEGEPEEEESDEPEEDSTEEEDEDLEQPEEDSDDNSEEDEVEETEAEDSTEEEEETDGEPEESEEEQPEVEEEDTKPEAQPVEPVPKTYKVKADGQEFEFSEEEIREQFPAMFAKAFDYTKKTQALKKHRQIVDVVEQEKLTLDDMNFAIDLLRGDKDAIATLIKRSGVDTLDLEVESEKAYAPKNYGRSDVELDIQEITAEISKDPEYETTHKILTKDWDDESWTEMTKKPQLIKLLHTDVKSGVFNKINTVAQKLRMSDEFKFGRSMKSDLEYYKTAVGVQAQEQAKTVQAETQRAEVESNQRKIADVKTAQAQRETTKKVASKRKAAAPTKTSAGTKKSVNYLEEALNMNDDDYLAWMQKKLK